MTIRPAIAAPISDLDSAKAWIDGLVAADLDFHFEDSPETIVTGPAMAPTFTADECAILRLRVDTLYALDWQGYECPIGYMLEVLEKAGR